MPTVIDVCILISSLGVFTCMYFARAYKVDLEERIELLHQLHEIRNQHCADTCRALARHAFLVEDRVAQLEGIRDATILKRPLGQLAKVVKRD